MEIKSGTANAQASSPGESDKFVFESENQPVNNIERLMKQLDEWKALDDLGFGDRYIKGKCRILLHARFAGKEYVAIFQRYLEVGQAETGSLEVAQHSWDVKPHVRDGDQSGEQRMVLVGNVRSMENPEVMVSTLIRFGSVDFIYGTLPHALYLSDTCGYVVRGVKDRETGLPQDRLSVNQDELTGQMIQGASQIMNDIPGNKADLGRRHLESVNIEDVISRLRIGLALNYTAINFHELRTLGFQVTELLYGPLDFGAYQREFSIGSHTS